MPAATHSLRITSPLGVILLHASDTHLVGLDIVPAERESDITHLPTSTTHPVLLRAKKELQDYFAGRATAFTVPIDLGEGTTFQKKVWEALQQIPFGDTLTYRELGTRAGVGNAPRAVGGAVGRNPIPIIVPCHRVLGHEGRITGYSAGEGIPTKEKLLSLESIPYRTSTTSRISSGRSVDATT